MYDTAKQNVRPPASEELINHLFLECRILIRFFRRNAAHYISPYAIVVFVYVCVCLCVCVYAAFVNLRKTV